MPAGIGFADIVYIPRHGSDKPAMVVELKYNQKAKTAIEQIKAKQYPKSLLDYKGNLLLVGVNYDKKTKEHTCEIEEMEV
jgi:aminoglycoside N3'-acetyltransferase